MSVRTVGSKFVELCRQGKNFDVMRTMYAPDIVSVEGDGKETAGQDPVIKKSEDWVSDKTFNGETVAGPFFNGANPDQFVVFFTLNSRPKLPASASPSKKSVSIPSRTIRSRASSSSTMASTDRGSSSSLGDTPQQQSLRRFDQRGSNRSRRFRSKGILLPPNQAAGL